MRKFSFWLLLSMLWLGVQQGVQAQCNFTVSIVDTSDCGDSMATLTVQTMPWLQNANIQWSNGATGYFVVVPRNAMYRVYVIDSISGCVGSDSVYVGATSGGFQVTSNVTQNCGTNTVVVSVAGGTQPFTYQWSSGVTGATAQNVPAGTSVVVRDASGCAVTHTPMVHPDSSFSVFLLDSTSCGDSMANVGAYPTPYFWGASYLWSDGSTQEYVYGLRGVVYSVTVTSPAGCTATASVSVPALVGSPLQVSGVITRPVCNAQQLGAAVDLTVTGGQPPYTYYWSNGERVEDGQNLPNNAYVFVEDSAGCRIYYSPGITGGITAYASIGTAVCGQANGSINLSTQAGNTFLWSNGATTRNISGLVSGWYGVTISNAQGCVYTSDYYVGLNPNCAAVISGWVYNATGTGACGAGQPRMHTGWVRLRNTATNYIRSVWVSNGQYSFSGVFAGTYELSYNGNVLNTQVSTLCPVGGIQTVVVASSGGAINGGDFYVEYPNQTDVRVLLSMGGAVPGFGHDEVVTICNYGGLPATGTIALTHDALLSAPTGSYYPTTYLAFDNYDAATHTITYNYTNLPIGVCTYVRVYFDLDASVALGTLLQGTAVATQAGDMDLSNNTATGVRTVVGSYDPNDKRMLRHRTGGEVVGGIYESDVDFEYVIRFQNTGTAPARRVVVRDTFEANLLPETVADIELSHAGVARIENGNILVVEFDGIYLPDSATDLEGSQGYIKFNMRRRAGLSIGTSIENSAAIYFDYNAPVITDKAISTLEALVQAVENQTDVMGVAAMPNPFGASVQVVFDLAAAGAVRVQLLDGLGRVVLVQAVEAGAGRNQINLEASELASGVYWLQVESAAGRSVQKLIKE